ncbi:MAG: hypothetical protein AAGJ28_05705 [Pseudomonadota bacterium]
MLNRSGLRLLMMGLMPRLLIVAVIIGLMWLGFFWAISPAGGT